MATTGVRRRSVLADLAGQWRFAGFSLAALPISMAVGAGPVLRVIALSDTPKAGIAYGLQGTAWALSFVLLVAPCSQLVDRGRPRLWLALGCLPAILTLVILGLVAMAGPVPMWLPPVLAIADGLSYALQAPAWQVVQADLVPDGVRGSATVVTEWRIAAGAIIGAVIASIAHGVFEAGVGLIIAGLAFGTLPLLLPLFPPIPENASRVRAERAETTQVSVNPVVMVQQILPDLRDNLRLRWAVVASIVLRLVVPLGVLYPVLVLADHAEGLTSFVSVASSVGAIVGVTVLGRLGIHKYPDRTAFIATLVTIASFLVAALSINSSLMTSETPWLFGLTTVGVAATTVAYTLSSAIVQDAAPDERRGRISAVVAIPNKVAYAVSSGGAGLLVFMLHPQVTMVFYAVLITVAVFVVLRRFSGLAEPGGSSG